MPAFAVESVFRAVDKFSPVMTKMYGSAGKFNTRVTAMTNGINKGFAHVLSPIQSLLPALSAVGIVEFGEKCIQAFEKIEPAIANVEAGLASTHNQIGIGIDDFKKMAGSLSKVGVFGRSDILQNSTAQLLTFGNIGKENFEMVQKAATDVTAKLYGLDASGDQLRSISIMMGKMMENPIRGITAARRIGISFSDSEEKVVKGMVDANNVMGAQQFMLAAIERQYGGTSAALMQTAKGADILRKRKLAGTMANIGAQLIPVKEQLMELADKMLEFVNVILPPTIEFLKVAGPYIIGIVAAMYLWKFAYGALTLATKAFTAVQMIQALGFKGYMATLKIGAIATKAITAAQWLWNIALTANPIGLIIVGIAAMIAISVIAIRNWRTFGAALTLILGPIGTVIRLVMILREHWDAIKNAFQTKGILGGLLEIGKALLDVVLYPIQQILELVSHIPGLGKFAKMGADKIKGFREGTLNAPNDTEVKARQSKTEVNLYNANPGSTAEVLPKRGAEINMDLGLNGAY
jgi:hypothetical protein